jgi:predicted adenine nucleotide alpha hydrolase (AANH) superfamily ATPase
MFPQVRESENVKNPYAINVADGRDISAPVKSILVHSCCGPCSTAVCERLARDFDITIYFYNPNITDRAEYERRLEAQQNFLDKYNARPDTDRKIFAADCEYEPEVFLERVIGLESEPEGGMRCAICFEMRLERTAEYAALHGFEYFTTTLSVSPHKDYSAICMIGTRLALKYGLTFYPEDFKKQNGYKRSVELSQAYGLYRQNYCGCEFSRNEEESARR